MAFVRAFGSYVPSHVVTNEELSALHDITISMTSSSGGTVVKGTGPSTCTDPVYVKVTVQWIGPRGITYTEIVTTMITDS